MVLCANQYTHGGNLGQVLLKGGGGLLSESFPRIVPTYSNCIYILFHCIKYFWKFFVNFMSIPLPLPIKPHAGVVGRAHH